jgi:hypothetical protein
MILLTPPFKAELNGRADPGFSLNRADLHTWHLAVELLGLTVFPALMLKGRVVQL